MLLGIRAARSSTLTDAGHPHLSALTGGYHIAFIVGALFATAAAITGSVLLRTSDAAAPAHEHAIAVEGTA
jgi:hypothetical protein